MRKVYKPIQWYDGVDDRNNPGEVLPPTDFAKTGLDFNFGLFTSARTKSERVRGQLSCINVNFVPWDISALEILS
ncbi:hypothetical protein N7471_012917 [Penicillium samsonianum]|uniref:uncharacterized protein n=1 Tax=Penicillium samsonianum TaxID=1882272 RepID=UPI002548CE9D|nr:uncharacterized protein N7471_012917 [Penicillium samsonianum]KAJ6125600.1 hypothetical protein N7471_012917 [Penicillium samsonianum]